MKPMPLRVRVIGALQLAPMTIEEVARVLSANVHSVRHYVEELKGMRVVSPVAGVKPEGRAFKVWRIN